MTRSNRIQRSRVRLLLLPLLFLLLSYPGRIFTRQELMDELWGTDTNTSPRTVDVHINRLRSRFAGREDFEISTIRGLGYKGVIKAAVR